MQDQINKQDRYRFQVRAGRDEKKNSEVERNYVSNFINVKNQNKKEMMTIYILSYESYSKHLLFPVLNVDPTIFLSVFEAFI